ncbi:MAG: TonB-dependent receptor [Caulobacteraceae bacterium]|nr:TonB-dependent receptor [Caulobacteraceae bacterium]
MSHPRRHRLSTSTRLPAFLAGGLVLGAALPAAAQAVDQPQPVSEVVVTATRLPQTLNTTPDAYVIDQSEIQARQITFAADALATVPGVSVASSGQFSLTSISIRGASADKTLVLIDGMPVNDPSQPAGNYDFSGLDLADVARIEVLTGPQGSLWGSDAIGGVIAFTTREPNGLRADVETGSLGETRVSAAAGRSTRDWAFGVDVADVASTGVSAADVRNNYAPYGAPGLRNIEPDGFRDLTLGARGRIDIGQLVQLDGQVRYSDSRAAIDGYPPPYYFFSDTNDVARSRSLTGFLRARFTGPWDLVNEVSASGYKIDRGDSGVSGDYGYRADREVYRWTVARGTTADPVSFEAGAEREDSRASLSTGDTADLGSTAVFGVVRWRPIDRLTLTASGRWDDPDRYHARATGRIAGALDLGRGFSLSASAGQGFKTPTISETVCDFCYTTRVTLRPELAVGYDAGLGWRSPDGRFTTRATVFGLNVTDEIEYVDGHYINVAHSRSDGVEAEGEAALGWGFRLKAAYTYTYAINADTHVRQLRIPLSTGSATLFWTRGKVDAAFTLRAEDTQPDLGLDGFTSVTRPGFVVADLAGGYALNSHIRISARIENLAGAHYEQVYGYGEPGRTVYVGLHLRD